jgi:hypothetical protein
MSQFSKRRRMNRLRAVSRRYSSKEIPEIVADLQSGFRTELRRAMTETKLQNACRDVCAADILAIQKRWTDAYKAGPNRSIDTSKPKRRMEILSDELAEQICRTWPDAEWLKDKTQRARENLVRKFRADVREIPGFSTRAAGDTDLLSTLGKTVDELNRNFIAAVQGWDLEGERNAEYAKLRERTGKKVNQRFDLALSRFTSDWIPWYDETVLRQKVEPNSVRVLFREGLPVNYHDLPSQYVNGGLILEDQLFYGFDLAVETGGDLFFRVDVAKENNPVGVLRHWQPSQSDKIYNEEPAL